MEIYSLDLMRAIESSPELQEKLRALIAQGEQSEIAALRAQLEAWKSHCLAGRCQAPNAEVDSLRAKLAKAMEVVEAAKLVCQSPYTINTQHVVRLRHIGKSFQAAFDAAQGDL